MLCFTQKLQKKLQTAIYIQRVDRKTIYKQRVDVKNSFTEVRLCGPV